ncbi:uncharacterized protein LOC128883604 [Hylaeus volcanicus]|uniref:uncharacterized protein LOC128883604 n=1 Tax=Hylaeus volcanicus TaxID=313075 RepID=UPI0023B7DCD4|nr:uncharacterized protein LOC128883604 [Hylaeus volcanicus]XP_053992117.1 uncharacterized protein LOC128883604 [Hylaeus volcanicus]XP_053992118.1 uncharacterized protein LOC128883604 [Hylaeus volcanicus]
MLNIFWSFLAEGNAHSVYRYIGPKSDTFTGMVLKLPKDTTLKNQTRLLRQYRFVKKVVIGSSMFPVEAFQCEDAVFLEKRNRTCNISVDPFVTKPKETVKIPTSDPDIINLPKYYPYTSEIYLFGFITTLNLENFQHERMKLPIEGLGIQTILTSFSLPQGNRYSLFNNVITILRDIFFIYKKVFFMINQQDNTEKYPPQKNSINMSKTIGLVHKMHIPYQKLQLLDEFHMLNVEMESLNHNLSIFPSFVRPTNQPTPPTSFYDLPLNVALSKGLTMLKEKSSLLGMNHCPCRSVVKHEPPHSSSEAFSYKKGCRELLSSFVKTGSPHGGRRERKKGLKKKYRISHLGKSQSYALLERDLITPPMAMHDLLGFPSCGVTVDSSDMNLLSKPKWVYFTCEMKPKTGLPMQVVMSESDDTFPSLSSTRFTLQQDLKLLQKEISNPSFYNPCHFFSHLSNEKVVFEQFCLLQKKPQNNCHLFINGTRIVWCDDQHEKQLEMETNKSHSNVNLFRVAPYPSPSTFQKCYSEQNSSLKHFSCPIHNLLHPLTNSHRFHNYIYLGTDTTIHQETLLPIFKLFATIVHKERNLLYRLLYIHSFCEGQQEVADLLLNYLIQKNWLSVRRKTPSSTDDSKRFMLEDLNHLCVQPLQSQKPFDPFSKGTTSNTFNISNIDHNFMSDEKASAALYDFRPFIQTITKKVWSQRACKQHGTTQNVMDSEMQIAQQLQKVHFIVGQNLLKEHEQVQDVCANNKIDTLKKKSVYWIYRYLVGRTFLDCSLMLNLALSIGEPVETDLCRFKKLCEFSLHNVLNTRSEIQTNGFNNASIQSCIQNLKIFQPTLDIKLNSKNQRVISSQKKRSTTTEKYRWTDVVSLIHPLLKKNELFQKSENTLVCESNSSFVDRKSLMLSVYYRVSLVDLDLKLASKIPRWAKQFRDILHVHKVKEKCEHPLSHKCPEHNLIFS